MGARLRNQATVGDLTGSSELLVPGRVISSTHIPQGSLTMPISAKSLRGDTEVVQIAVGTNSIGTLDLDSASRKVWRSSDVHWVRALRLADDCHSYNVQLRKYHHHHRHHHHPQSGDDVQGEQWQQKLVLQAVRPVEPGQELLLWFSEDILATLHMGFLTPANIQGQKNYLCTKCSTLYESPNPLKLHLMLGCGKYPIKCLWEKLSFSLTNKEQQSHKQNNFHFSLRTTTTSKQENESCLVIPMQKIAIDLSSDKQTAAHHEPLIFKPYGGGSTTTSSSAFKPFVKLSSHTNVPCYYNSTLNNGLIPSINSANDLATRYFNDYTRRINSVGGNGNGTSDEDAQIETLVSSLGKFKEGHVCLYCGKSYSRKYGLKIHIRTHTGYKPLKCKFCMRPFGDPSNLNKHVRLHEGETPYKCELCGKVLVRRRDLERHLKSRHVQEITATPDGKMNNNNNNNNNSLDDYDDDDGDNDSNNDSTDGSVLSNKSMILDSESGSNNKLIVD